MDKYSTPSWFAMSVGIVFCVDVLELIPVEPTLQAQFNSKKKPKK